MTGRSAADEVPDEGEVEGGPCGNEVAGDAHEAVRHIVAPGEPAGPPEAFMIDREFAHLHPAPDHSLHAMLPTDVARAAIDAGWAELHPVARMGLLPPTAVMLYAPRDEAELSVVEQLVGASHRFARPA